MITSCVFRPFYHTLPIFPSFQHHFQVENLLPHLIMGDSMQNGIMIIFKRVSHLREWVSIQKQVDRQIGFVPTMGALHEGHLSLIEASIEECHLTIVSIFVNPKQFNDPGDLLKYPRPIEADLQLLLKYSVDVLFLPDVEDIYPINEPVDLNLDTGDLGNVMEGIFRPGHFAGVAAVMYRLLTLIAPDHLYMGQKDFQQVAIVNKLIEVKKLPVKLIMCPTLREANGLAMSSRNSRLSSQARNEAGIIYATLANGRKDFENGVSLSQISEQAIKTLTRDNFQPEYFSIVNGETLKDLTTEDKSSYVVACCAVQVEGVRLIDNMIWKKN